ncbi:PAS domain-containing protein [Methylobacterium longum]|uniref:histidine kinase n=1 Tax=Methylobacterium longum TaxID=767694 RepID=A0ABT8AP97_9HYPH|nr:PAS domain-containing protein [Methylobacterium longum]MDN3571575.1 PAS domain-containing protein [Methylobacterium longum]
MIDSWEWDAATDRSRVDGFVALLFDVDPDEAAAGVPLSFFIDSIHPEDRERVDTLIRRCGRKGSTYLTEYRVISVDGQTRWVLARGRFSVDHLGRPVGGAGILVDITRMREGEGTFGKINTVSGEAPLDRAADHAIAAQQAIVELQDPELKVRADALLMALGRKLAHETDRRKGCRRHADAVGQGASGRGAYTDDLGDGVGSRVRARDP